MSKDPIDETFIMLFEIVDKLSQKGLATSAKKNVALLESLSVRQQKTLYAVISMTKFNPTGVNLKDLAARMNITVPAASVLVESMVQRGFLEREINPNDRRAVCISISATGHQIFNVIRQEMSIQVNKLADLMSSEERTVFENVIARFYKELFP
ncbi:MAG: MarR family transcriptional regulator [Thermoguttaceae bacterium]|nr:MarR family transcriptional regulator [Thermoguttaceae bacterium]